MLTTTRISEQALSYRLECPMRSAASIVIPESPVLACTEDTARWLTNDLCAGREPTGRETLEFFDARWKQTTYSQSRNDFSFEAIKKDARLVSQGIRACRRLRDLLWRCEILQPVSPYELQVGDVVIRGEYAVLRRPRPKTHAFALYLRHKGVRSKPLIPDIVSYARRVDLAKRWVDPAHRHWGIQHVSVLHFWVSQDLSMHHHVDSSFATDVLLGAAGVVAGHPFPVSGEHCRSCLSRACQ